MDVRNIVYFLRSSHVDILLFTIIGPPMYPFDFNGNFRNVCNSCSGWRFRGGLSLMFANPLAIKSKLWTFRTPKAYQYFVTHDNLSPNLGIDWRTSFRTGSHSAGGVSRWIHLVPCNNKRRPYGRLHFFARTNLVFSANISHRDWRL